MTMTWFIITLITWFVFGWPVALFVFVLPWLVVAFQIVFFAVVCMAVGCK